MPTDTAAGTPTTVVAHRAGITYRQLDHWLRNGYVSCSHNPHAGAGRRRRWTSAEVDHVLQVATLVKVGFLPERAVELLRDAS